jgi:hypothetical protein
MGGGGSPQGGVGGTPGNYNYGAISNPPQQQQPTSSVFGQRDQFGRMGPFAGRDPNGNYLGGRMNMLHPGQQQGPFPGRDANGNYPNQQNLFTGGTPMLGQGGTPLGGVLGDPGGNANMNAFNPNQNMSGLGGMLQQILGSGGFGGGGYGNNMLY